MKKLLLLDTDVVIDLHTLELFEKMGQAYDILLTKEAFKEANHYYDACRVKRKIDIADKVTIIDDIDIECLKKVYAEAKEALLGIDPGEATSIAYLIQGKEDAIFCSCDKAAIHLVSYMEFEQKAISLEKALQKIGRRTTLYPRHLEKSFQDCIKQGKTLRIQFKKLI